LSEIRKCLNCLVFCWQCQSVVRCNFITKFSDSVLSDRLHRLYVPVSVLSDPTLTTSVYPVCCTAITRRWQYTGNSARVMSEIKNYSQCLTSFMSVCCQTDIYVTSLLSVCRQSVASILSVCWQKLFSYGINIVWSFEKKMLAFVVWTKLNKQCRYLFTVYRQFVR